VAGRVEIRLKKAKKFDHTGIKLELFGRIEMYGDKSQTSDFLSMSRDLEGPGAFSEDKTLTFAFARVEKPYETYSGINCRVRYFIKVTIGKNYASNIIREQDFCVQNSAEEMETTAPLKMEVGIEECLHIEFEYNKQRYHLRDCIVGKVYFLLVRIRIKYMEVAIIKREVIGSGTNATTENETVAKFEVMDGAPVRGENIPIRVYLSAYDLTPSLQNVNNRFSVKYYLNLVLVDEEDRRYFKQQEIILWRRAAA
jgi:hypothetical protein